MLGTCSASEDSAVDRRADASCRNVFDVQLQACDAVGCGMGAAANSRGIIATDGRDALCWQRMSDRDPNGNTTRRRLTWSSMSDVEGVIEIPNINRSWIIVSR